jgi:hypothetical protein
MLEILLKSKKKSFFDEVIGGNVSADVDDDILFFVFLNILKEAI